ncbi:MAG: hypothetical protein EOR67_30670 [Mesorhizobium sp.]|uniref:hypothetical protein n=1 Tax=Mesorhizobium sp. TaxID=1871066 RepID=UPI000FE8D1EF|nr:hypothetical protein [Mesorhizobium sp.]RWL75861.1 MAG: hypothetical protein EOR69_31485 [Mesorhizobium sp.]RWL80959.1 MAG: hypothetical protein EOR67_30670 [Mesorhizobium sp.]RWL96417.1 MAG: hypothetical protein EOR70_18665 [Mesorhizobium sp.]
MRLLGAFGIGLLAMNGAAHASSIVVLGVSTSTPSVVRLDAIDPAKLSALSAPSMIALGDPVPAVTDEKVAAIPEKSGHQPAPMIIRGGIVGGAFATPAATAAARPTAPATTTAAAPANGTSPATPANGTASASKANDKAGSQPTATANASGGAQPPNAQPLPRVGKAM